MVVESPAKANTIKKYLGSGYVVKASVGHVKDLPRKTMGIDIANDFAPEYEVIEGKKKVLAEIKSAAKRVARVLLAPDPDREGEAIAWHIAEELRPSNPNIQRVLFNEITKKAVNEAILRPLELDVKKFESQQARRILDRLVGYEISPVLWAKVKRGLSAGRVQSVAVRLVVDREDEIRAFHPEEYWTIDATVEGGVPPPFSARVARLDGQKAQMTNEGETLAIVDLMKDAPLVVSSVERKERRKFAPPPFITSKLQQEASSKLRFSPKRTMGLAQRLYEGVELGEEGPVGLITYMRTDSTRLSDDAITEVRAYISGRYGADRLPTEPNTWKSKKGAQDAHEAIRPTSTRFDPETVRRLMTESGGREAREIDDLVKLYTLIWNRFVACQMIPAVFDQTAIDIEAGRVGLRATGQVIKVPGFLEVYAETVEDAAAGGREHRQPARGPGGRDPQAAGDQTGAALHPAAAALLGGHAGQGAGGEGHRPPVHLRRHPVDGAGARLRREAGESPLPDRARVRWSTAFWSRASPRSSAPTSPPRWKSVWTRWRRAGRTGWACCKNSTAPFRKT